MISKLLGRYANLFLKIHPFYHQINHSNNYHFATTKNKSSQSSLYDLYTSKTHFHHKINSFSYRFRNQQIMLYCYFTQPNVHKSTQQPLSPIVIDSNNILTLTFVHSTTPEMSDSAWQQRKLVLLNFKEVMQIMKLKPKSKQTKQIIQNYQFLVQQQNKQLKYKKTIHIADIIEEKQIHFNIKQQEVNDEGQYVNTKWELKYVFIYEDYVSFLEVLKKNIIFISGAAVSIEISKLNNLYKPEIKDKPAKKQQKNDKKQTKTKAEKPTKEKKVKTATKKAKTQ